MYCKHDELLVYFLPWVVGVDILLVFRLECPLRKTIIDCKFNTGFSPGNEFMANDVCAFCGPTYVSWKFQCHFLLLPTQGLGCIISHSKFIQLIILELSFEFVFN